MTSSAHMDTPPCWKRAAGHVIAFGGVEVHVFLVAVGGQEIIAAPNLWAARAAGRIDRGEPRRLIRILPACRRLQSTTAARLRRRVISSRRARVRPGRTDFLVYVLHLAGGLAFYLQRVAVKLQIGADKRNRR